MLMHDAQTIDGLSDVENSVSLDDVYIALGWESDKNDKDIKEYVRTLVTTPVEWNEKRIDKSVEWTICTFLSKGRIFKGRLYYRINPEIVAQVQRPTLYAKMVLLAQTQLRKKPSLILYEYFQGELGRFSDEIVQVQNVSIDFLLDILGQKSEYYQQYKHLNREILKPATKEINKYTDIDVVYERVAKGRVTIGITFSLTRKLSYQLSLDLDGVHNKKDIQKKSPNPLMESLAYYGVTAKVASALIGKYSAERINGNIRHLKDELSKGKKISNKGAWLRKAIEEDWQPKSSEVDADTVKKKQEELKTKFDGMRAQQRAEKINRDFIQFRGTTLRTRFLEKSKTFQDEYLASFLDRMRKEGNTIIIQQYNDSGLESAFVASLFFPPLESELLTEPHEQSVEAFERWQQEQVAEHQIA